ncbi:MAG: ATP-binding protein [Lachnobacterium sp.]|nr:ATP-binding protein [Lachnobacterium sp.]
MKQKINVRLIGIAVLAVLATLICMTCVYYSLFQKQVRKDLQVQAQVLGETGAFQNVQTRAKSFDIAKEDLRITWIDTDGTVLYDNDADANMLENHANRPEVKSALQTGEGECVRNSNTMNMTTFYYALRLENGMVLRVATQARSIWNVFLTAAPMIAGILILIIVVCIFLAHVLTRQLLQPIKVMAENMEDTSKTPAYKELVPFVNTIRAQHENILMAAKVRQDFTANVSHELKTPLTAISGYAELIENHMVDPEQETRFAQEIQQNANRLLSLINDIIRLSELDNSENLVRYEQVDLDLVAQESVNNLTVNAEKRGVKLYYEGEPCTLRADRGMLTELVDNLAANAIRYNNEGGEVHVKVKHENQQPVLMVSDNGIGIPKDQQDRIFERFYRVDKSRSKQTGGTGLGLAIVKHIVELHDAQITVESEPGKGTMMKVTF